jgi:hypothetical protein
MLNVNGQSVGNRGARELAEALQCNTNLVVLFLDNNEITASGMKVLAPAIASHPALEFVYLSYNAIGCGGAVALAAALRENSSSSKLQVLKLSDCGIGLTGARALAEALPASLHTLTLDGNHIQTAGATAFAEALKKNAALKHLHLRHNKLNLEATQRAFCKVLSDNNQTLCELLLEEEENHAADKQSARELQFWCALNGTGRRSFGDTTVSAKLWPRVLSKAGMIQSSVLFSVIASRPDLLTSEQQKKKAGDNRAEATRKEDVVTCYSCTSSTLETKAEATRKKQTTA